MSIKNIKLKSRPLLLSDLEESLSENGAQVIFIGKVRLEEDLNYGKLIGLEYSAHFSLAMTALKNIYDDVLKKKITNLQIIHSLGMVKVNEISMIMSIESIHRNEIFNILNDCVKRVKKEVPIWKLEHFNNGKKWSTGTPLEF